MRAARLIMRVAAAFRRAAERRKNGERYFTGRFYRSVKTLAVTLFTSPRHFPRLLGYYVGQGRVRYRQPAAAAAAVLLPAAAAALLLGTLRQYRGVRPALEVMSAGQTLGVVRSEEVYRNALARAGETLGENAALPALPDLSYALRFVPETAFTDEETLTRRLLRLAVPEATPACGVYLDGEYLGAVENEDDAKSVFAGILTEAAEADRDAVTGFLQQIAYKQLLLMPGEGQAMSRAAFKTLCDRLTAEKKLNVKVTRTATETVSVPYGQVEISSDALYIGTSRVVVNGRSGEDQVTSLVTYVDGEAIESRELLRYQLKAPVDEQVQVGSRALDASFVQATGYGGILIWPAIGATHLNSDYEWRWGKLHAALDIGSSVGTSLGKLVVAAAEGTVVIAGVHSSYGYYVKIDHGNGMQTLYAHCLAGSLMVSPGDHVDAGAPIARIGMTGYATGPHLHFEVIINGNRVDPKPYLGI